MSNQIIIPQFLINDSNFCLKINQKNNKMFDHVDYLRQLVTNIHQIYLKMCKRMAVISDQFQRKVVNTKNAATHAQVVLNFMKNLDFLHLAISSQLNNNNVTLGTKSHKIVKNRLQILHQKLVKSDKLNKIFVQKANHYNEKQLKYQKQCNYFNNYQKDVLKYYSLKQNTELYETIANQQIKLKYSLDQIYEIKDEYKINISEIRITQNEYFEMEKNIISEYKKLFQYIKKIMCEPKQIYNQPIIEEKSEEGNTSIFDLQSKSMKVDRLSIDKWTTQMRKDKIKEFHACLEIEQHFFKFIAIFQEELNSFGQSIDQIRSEKQFKTFISSKLIMSEILSLQSITEIDYIINQVSQFRATILNLTAIFGKIKFLVQLQKYRGLNFDKFMEESAHFVDVQKRDGPSLQTRNEYKNVEHKYVASNHEYMVRFRQKIIQIQTDIDDEYAQRQQIVEHKNKRPLKNNSLEGKYYQILANPFFTKKQQNTNFTTNSYLQNYSALLNANQVQKMMTLSKFQTKKKSTRKKTTCCGLFCIDQEKGPALIDQYYCALKDGYMLVQGKLSLYENYINFYSTFNSKTLFGYCDIRIPKWDILQFVKDKHILSLLIVVETSHGKIGFTSFLTDPYRKLVDLYDHRKSGATLIKIPTKQHKQLQQLQQRFQCQFQASLLKCGFKIDKLSTYLSEDKLMLSISIEFHINGTDQNIFFEIKINQTDVAIEYYFIHDQKCHQIEVKQKLESIAKELITPNNRQEHEFIGKKQKEVLNSISPLTEYSVILPNENNKISLQQPSFINIKLDHNSVNEKYQDIRNLDFTHLLSSDSKNYSQELRTSNAKLEPAQFSRFKHPKVSPRSQIPEVSEEITTRLERAHQKNSTKSTRQKKAGKESREYRLILYLLGVLLALNLILQQFS